MAVANKLDKLLPIAKRVLRYLKGAAEVGLIYPIMKRNDLIVSGVVDSDFAGDTTKKSTYCRYTYLDRCLINFTTKLQKTVATSTCNAGFNGIAEAMTDVIYYRACTAELKGKFWPKELSLHSKLSAVQLSKSQRNAPSKQRTRSSALGDQE